MNSRQRKWISFANLFRCSHSFTNSPQTHPFFANSLSIHYQFSQIHIEFTFCFPKSLKIYNLYREFTTNWFPTSRIHNEFTIYWRNSKRIHYLFRQFSRINFQFIIFIAFSLRIHFFLPRIKFHIYIYIANSLGIPYLFFAK